MTTATVEKLTIVAKTNADALSKSGTAAFSGLESLAKAYQAVVSRNIASLTSSFQALTAVKTPIEFFEVQQKLAKEGLAAALADGRALTELTNSVVTAAFKPVQTQVAAFQNLAKFSA